MPFVEKEILQFYSTRLTPKKAKKIYLFLQNKNQNLKTFQNKKKLII